MASPASPVRAPHPGRKPLLVPTHVGGALKRPPGGIARVCGWTSTRRRHPPAARTTPEGSAVRLVLVVVLGGLLRVRLGRRERRGGLGTVLLRRRRPAGLRGDAGNGVVLAHRVLLAAGR